MGQIKDMLQNIGRMIIPMQHKTQVYYAINILFLIAAILAYYHPFLRFVGITYTLILGFTLFAGIKSLENEDDKNNRGGLDWS